MTFCSRSTPERYSIRAENYLLDADIYLSRATSAHARGDEQSAQLFATLSAQTILKITIEAARLPLSCSRYLEILKTATKQLDADELFQNYLAVAKVETLNAIQVEERLSCFKQVWDEMFGLAKSRASLLDSMHVRIRTKLNYYSAPAFLQGAILRSQALLNEAAHQEAAHYLIVTLADVLENYAWLRAAEQNTRLDYTTLLRFLKGQKQTPARVYNSAVGALGLENVDEKKVEETVATAKRLVSDVRQKRRMFADMLRQEAY